jgi:hypothetical protein
MTIETVALALTVDQIKLLPRKVNARHVEITKPEPLLKLSEAMASQTKQDTYVLTAAANPTGIYYKENFAQLVESARPALITLDQLYQRKTLQKAK